jgi:hypothetical protein
MSDVHSLRLFGVPLLSVQRTKQDIMKNEPASKRVLCPSYPFDSDLETIKLTVGIKIGRAPDEFREILEERCAGTDSFWDESSKVARARIASIPYPGKALDLGVAEPKKHRGRRLADSFLSTSIEVQESVFCFVTGLRLCREGLVTPGPIAVPLFRGQEPMWLVPSWLNFRSERYRLEDPKTFILRAADVPQVDSILSDVHRWQGKRDPGNMDVALTRFHSSYGGEPEERVIDQMIAFEALLLGGEQELQYRLALRVASLTGEDATSKRSIFDDMRDAYQLRSKIMHGSARIDRGKLENILPKTEEYLRRSVRKFLSLLSQGYKFKYLRDKSIDSKIPNRDMCL